MGRLRRRPIGEPGPCADDCHSHRIWKCDRPGVECVLRSFPWQTSTLGACTFTQAWRENQAASSNQPARQVRRFYEMRQFVSA